MYTLIVDPDRAVRYTDIPTIPVLNPLSVCLYDFFSNTEKGDIPKFPAYHAEFFGITKIEDMAKSSILF